MIVFMWCVVYGTMGSKGLKAVQSKKKEYVIYIAFEKI